MKPQAVEIFFDDKVTKVVYIFRTDYVSKAYFFWKGGDFALSSVGWTRVDFTQAKKEIADLI